MPNSRPRVQARRIDRVLLYSARRYAVDVHPDRSVAGTTEAKFGRRLRNEKHERMVERMARNRCTSVR
jgi:hypothetical protein